VYWNLLFHCFLIAQHVSGDTPLTIRSSKTAIAGSGWLPAASIVQPSQRPATNQPEAAIAVFELLMMGGVSPETC
jgi:hypothetical protein